MVAAVVLAASGGQRYGGPKALLQVNGTSLIQYALLAAREATCDPIVVVLGSDAARVRGEAALDGVRVVENPNWRGGTGSSVRVGLRALMDCDDPATAAALLLVDTPGVGPEAVRRLSDGVDDGSLRTATYGGRRGYPVVVGRDHWAGMSLLAGGDVGPRAYLAAHSHRVTSVICDDVAEGAEYDIPATP